MNKKLVAGYIIAVGLVLFLSIVVFILAIPSHGCVKSWPDSEFEHTYSESTETLTIEKVGGEKITRNYRTCDRNIGPVIVSVEVTPHGNSSEKTIIWANENQSDTEFPIIDGDTITIERVSPNTRFRIIWDPTNAGVSQTLYNKTV